MFFKKPENPGTAVELDWKHQWDTGAPLPHVLASENALFLIYLTNADEQDEVAVVTFHHSAVHSFGGPNDEVLHGHPLYSHGLEFYSAHEVRNSKWLAEIQKINSVHYRYNPARWRAYRHYLFTFHDSIFECIAEGYDVEVFRQSLAETVMMVTQRLLSQIS